MDKTVGQNYGNLACTRLWVADPGGGIPDKSEACKGVMDA
jgi:hypothetical protein